MNVFNGTSVKVHHTCYAPLTTAEKCVQIDLEIDITQFLCVFSFRRLSACKLIWKQISFSFCVCLVSGSCQRTIVRFNHLGEVRVKVAVGKHFLNFSLQVLMRLLISSSVFCTERSTGVCCKCSMSRRPRTAACKCKALAVSVKAVEE